MPLTAKSDTEANAQEQGDEYEMKAEARPQHLGHGIVLGEILGGGIQTGE